MEAPTIEDIVEARERIKPHAHVTPVLTCSTIDSLAGKTVYFKCEQFQKVGAFKFRGACNAVFKLDHDAAAKGVVTHSSGNHAQALALAARMRGIPAHIVMPSTSPQVKQNAVAGYGGQIVLCEPTLAARESTTQQILEKTGCTLIHPYNHPWVIAGQGTVALELLDQVPELDAIITPVGGGGLLSGVCIAAKAIKPSIRIFAGEPLGADDAARSMAAGQFVPQTAPKTIADGLMTSLGTLTWPIIKDNVEMVITVTDDEIKEAMKLVWERMKIIVEPSGAVPLAAVLTDKFKQIPGIHKVGVVFSGGSIFSSKNMRKIPNLISQRY